MRAVLGRNFTLGLNALGVGNLTTTRIVIFPGVITTSTTGSSGGITIIYRPSVPSHPGVSVTTMGGSVSAAVLEENEPTRRPNISVQTRPSYATVTPL